MSSAKRNPVLEVVASVASPPHDRRFPFEVRRVCQATRRYVFVERLDKYHDACLVADVAVEVWGEHHVVWDMKEERVLYDSRKLVR